MSKKFDTSWFNLNNYEGLKDLDLYGWYQQLAIRDRIKSILLSYDDILGIEGEDLNDFEEMQIYEAVSYREILDSDGDWEELYAAPTLRWIEQIKHNPIIDLDDSKKYKLHKSDLKYPFNTYSIISTPAYIIYLLAADDQLRNVWKICNILYKDMEEVTKKQTELIKTPYDLLSIDEGILENKGLAHVTVDLTATDEQIKKDFSHWLSEYRKATNFRSNKGIFTKKDLSDWCRERLLPYIDLKLIASIEGKKYTTPRWRNLFIATSQM